MENPKLRKLIILLHLYAAAFMAPAFLLVATSGGLYLLDKKGEVTTTDVTLPASAQLDFKSPTIEADVRSLLSTAGIDHKFEYVRNRGSRIELRPTSRPYLEILQTDEGLKARRHKPNLQKSMIEIHKGHGPKLMKVYHKAVALALILVVFGGIFVGLLAKAYRRKTIVASVLGLVIYLAIAFLA